MALPDLATTADLTTRGAAIEPAVEATMLAVASTIVREAAGSPILQTTSTVTVGGWGERNLTLPGQPVMAVSAVSVDGQAVGDHQLVDGRLWRYCGFGWAHCPASVTVTYTHGLATVPADIVDLVCNLVIAGAAALEEGGGTRDPRTVAEEIDDYSVTWAKGAEAVATVMELPPGTRRLLASRFGGGAGMVTHR